MNLIERQNLDIDGSEARKLLADTSFNALVDAGILDLLRTKGGRFSIRAAQFVGRAKLQDGRDVVVSEKAPGALAGMLPWASPSDIRDVLLDSDVTSSGTMLSILLERFLFAVSRYINQRKKAYIPYRVSMISPRGRIDTNATARLRARGCNTRIACIPMCLSAKLPPNALIALALLSLESWVGLPGVNSEFIIKARSLLPFFSEFDFPTLRRMGWQTRSREFQRELQSPFRSKEMEAALGYGRPIALHSISTFGSTFVASIPASFFLNLESLFEDAVLNCLKDCVGDAAVQRPTEISRLPLLDKNVDRYRASPDAICTLLDGVTIVADCKYKTLDGTPGHSDLYQILAHADAYAAKLAVLIYPGEVFETMPLGRSRGGVQVYFATIRCSQIRTDIERIASAFLLREDEASQQFCA